MDAARWVMVLVPVMLAGCVMPQGEQRQGAKAGGGGAEGSAPGPPAHASAWLNPEAAIESAVLLITPAGTDLRQAAYLRQSAESRGLLVMLRDYTTRTPGKPDPQQITRVQLDDGAFEAIQLEDGAQPLGFRVSPSRTRWLCNYLAGLDQAGVGEAALHTAVAEQDEAPEVFGARDDLFALGFVDDDTFLGRKVKAAQLEGGLVALSLDWGAEAEQGILAGGLYESTAAGSFVPGPSRGLRAGYEIAYDPALPKEARITYAVERRAGAGQQQRWSFDYHVSYSPFEWLPPLVWLDEDSLATIMFRPDAAGRSAKANYRGAFNVVALDVGSGETRLIANQALPDLPLAAADGVLFHTLVVGGPDAARWELWARSADGLDMQRLWASDDAVYLSVEDVLEGRRLAVHRQYFEIVGGQPELRSELREFSLDPMPEIELPIRLDGSAGQLTRVEEAGPDVLTPSSPGEPPPISMP